MVGDTPIDPLNGPRIRRTRESRNRDMVGVSSWCLSSRLYSCLVACVTLQRKSREGISLATSVRKARVEGDAAVACSTSPVVRYTVNAAPTTTCMADDVYDLLECGCKARNVRDCIGVTARRTKLDLSPGLQRSADASHSTSNWSFGEVSVEAFLLVVRT